MTAVDEGLTSVSFLSQALGQPVRSVRLVRRLGADRGYAGMVVRLVLEPVEGGPVTVIAKTGGLGAPDAMQREVAFYRDLAAQVRAPTPPCWYAGHMPDGTPVVLMDEGPDVAAGDALTGATADEVEAVLAAMAPVWSHGSGPPADKLPTMPVDPAVARWLGTTDLGALVDQGRLALARYFAGVIGWHSRPSSGDAREAALRAAALHDGRLLNALTRWDVTGLGTTP